MTQSKTLMPELGTLDESLVQSLRELLPNAHTYGNPNAENNSGRRVEVLEVAEGHPIYAEVWALCTAYSESTGIQFDSIQELALMRYGANDGYKPHTDYAVNDDDQYRKISFAAQLNDDYSGGELIFSIGNKSLKVPKGVGNYVIFPSFLMHEVRSVVSGMRLSCVAWTIGRQWQ